ncbi:MAG: type II secretion system GspH family protein [Phycisphaerales bacterium]|nr:type II secretion system GspH family protein [Phycisphaerales bacterium]
MMNRFRTHLGFTLLELMVAVVVLLAIMVAVGRIFTTTSEVSASGQAIAETLQQGVAIEQQIRDDIAKITTDGFFAIRSVSVANNIRGNYFLLDESLPPESIIRCDQLIFFTTGIMTPAVKTPAPDESGKCLDSMIYYGHGVRFPQLEGQVKIINGVDIVTDESDDLKHFNSSIPNVITPWYEGAVEVETRRYTNGSNTRFDLVADGDYYASGTQKEPSDWILMRQEIGLGDDDQQDADDDGKKTYMNDIVSSQTVFPWDPRIEALPGNSNEVFPHILNSRVDAAATQLADIRQGVLQDVESAGDPNRNWRFYGDGGVDQQELIASLFRWPRGEPVPASEIRYDQALMVGAIAEGCASFKVEWTYDEGVGYAEDANGNWFTGYAFDQLAMQPWFGESYRLNPADVNDLQIGYETLSTWTANANGGVINGDPAWSIDPSLIETSFDVDDGYTVAPVPTVQDITNGVSEYWAIFGYNGNDPFYENDLDFLNDTSPDSGPLAGGGMDDGVQPGDTTWRYTPWPSALRITVRLNDQDQRLGSGWTYQFVVDMPWRGQ